jgi:PAS domain S-box-containing protein
MEDKDKTKEQLIAELAELRQRITESEALETKLKRAEEALRENKDRYRDIFENVSDLLYFHDLEGNFIETNPAWKKEYGFNDEDLANLNLRDLIPEGYKYQFEVYLKRVKENGKDQGFMRVMTKDGSESVLEYRSSLIYDSTGPIGVRGSARDFSEGIQASEALIESEARYRALFKGSAEGILVADIETKEFIYANPSICRMLGYNEEELKKTGVSDIHPKADLEHVISEFEAQARGEKTLAQDIPCLRKDGEIIYADINTSKVFIDGRECNVGFFTDITKEKKLQAQVQRAQKMEAIGTLAGGVAHDLNNILAGLVSYPDLLLMEIPEDSPLRNPILTIQKSGEKAATIVEDLLTLARRGVAVTEVVNLNDIVSEYVKSPEHERLISFHAGVHIRTDLEEDLLNTLGSPAHVSKTIMNLVSNAAEAMPEGGEISISTENQYIDRPVTGYDHVEEGDYSVLRVSDTGVGISKKDRERIFEPFYTKKVMGRSGTGLGMTVVWGTVKDHKGYIDIQSAKGKGTTFTIYFPVSRKEVDKDKVLISIEDYMAKGESVLVIDDVKEQREIASKILNKLGYSVTTVSSGVEAVDYLKDNSADLLVLDMIMDPGIDGYETYKRILEFHPKQKALIVSGFSETKRVKEAQRLGAGAYIKKPFLLEKIGLAVREELGR